MNNFDFIRLVSALAVLVSHQFALSGRAEPYPTSFHSLGGTAVLVFFTISGYLISQSWNRDPHILRFSKRRLLRIWPALVFVTLASAFILGPTVTDLSLEQYLVHRDVWRFLEAAIFTIRYELPGVFENNPLPRAVNGSLWTIPVEVQWYAVLLTAGAVGLLKRKSALLAATVAFAAYTFILSKDRSFWNELGVFMCAGACLNAYRTTWEPRPLSVFVALASLAGVFLWIGYGFVTLFLTLPFAAIWLGTSSTPVLRAAGRFGDVSYGVYLFAFPVQQMVIWWRGGDRFLENLAVSGVLTLLLAFVCWHLVEKQALKLKPSAKEVLHIREEVSHRAPAPLA